MPSHREMLNEFYCIPFAYRNKKAYFLCLVTITITCFLEMGFLFIPPPQPKFDLSNFNNFDRVRIISLFAKQKISRWLCQHITARKASNITKII